MAARRGGYAALPWEHVSQEIAAPDNGPVADYTEIGRAFGISRERARQIEAESLKKFELGLAIFITLGADEAEPLLESLRGKKVAAYYSAFLSVISRCGEPPSASPLKKVRAAIAALEGEL